ncbi:MAG: hypothetical protein R2932_52475 [Caldilineaceae bacterium]
MSDGFCRPATAARLAQCRCSAQTAAPWTATIRPTLCVTLNNGLVQYVRKVNTKGQIWIYIATISVGNSGQGTFSFNALAASAINVRTLGKRRSYRPMRSRYLGRTADGNIATAGCKPAWGRV